MKRKKLTHLILWVLVLTLSAFILKWPVNYTYEYEAVQALSAINHVFAFGIVYSAWIVCLFILARQSGFAGNALLVSIFGLVNAGFFVINCPYVTAASFDPSGLSYANYIMTHGRFILGNPQWGYFEFPANALLDTLVAHLTGLSVIIASKLILVLACILLPLSAYTFYFKLIGKSFLSFIGTFMAVLGSVFLLALDQFRPETLGFLLIAPFFVVVSLDKNHMGKQGAQIILLILLFATIVITHFISCAVLIFMLAGIFIYQKIIKKDVLSFNIIFVFIVLALSWWIYISLFTTGYVGNRFMAFISDPSNVSLIFAFRKAQSLIGGEVPLWASLIRTFWLLFLYALPCLIALIALIALLSHKRRTQNVKIELGVVLGLVLLTIAMELADVGGNRSIETFFLYATLIMPLVILRTICNEKMKLFVKKLKLPSNSTILIVFGLLLVVIAFPTFLANNPSVNTQVIYDREYATFSFINNYEDSSDQHNLFCDGDTAIICSYFMEDDQPNLFPYAPEIVQNQSQFFTQVPLYLKSFNDANDHPLFIYSPRLSQGAYLQLDISEQDPIWDEVNNSLEYDDRIFENGFDSIIINQR